MLLKDNSEYLQTVISILWSHSKVILYACALKKFNEFFCTVRSYAKITDQLMMWTKIILKDWTQVNQFENVLHKHFPIDLTVHVHVNIIH